MARESGELPTRSGSKKAKDKAANKTATSLEVAVFFCSEDIQTTLARNSGSPLLERPVL